MRFHHLYTSVHNQRQHQTQTCSELPVFADSLYIQVAYLKTICIFWIKTIMRTIANRLENSRTTHTYITRYRPWGITNTHVPWLSLYYPKTISFLVFTSLIGSALQTTSTILFDTYSLPRLFKWRSLAVWNFLPKLLKSLPLGPQLL